MNQKVIDNLLMQEGILKICLIFNGKIFTFSWFSFAITKITNEKKIESKRSVFTINYQLESLFMSKTEYSLPVN